MKKAQTNKLGLQTVQNEKELNKPIDGNNQVKSDKKKHIEQKKTSDLKNKVNTPHKGKSCYKYYPTFLLDCLNNTRQKYMSSLY